MYAYAHVSCAQSVGCANLLLHNQVYVRSYVEWPTRITHHGVTGLPRVILELFVYVYAVTCILLLIHFLDALFQMADIYLAITAAGTVHFAQPDALKVTVDMCTKLMHTYMYVHPMYIHVHVATCIHLCLYMYTNICNEGIHMFCTIRVLLVLL